jgi:hypothetical protein
MRGEAQLLLWIAGVHVLGFVCVGVLMIPALRGTDDSAGGSEGGSDDGWGNLPVSPPKPGRWPGGGIPLPDAVQSHVRLREEGRLHDRLAKPERRPAREPVRRPVRALRSASGSPRRCEFGR